MPVTTVLKLDEIKRLIDIPQLIREIEAGFVLYSEGRVTVPPVGFLHFDEPPGDVHIKYGFVSGDEYYVLKMASGFYNNPELGLPISNGLLLVFSQKTGELELILLDECWLTDMRTAAAGAVAAKHLAAKNIHHIGIVGTGVQARLQLEILRDVVDCKSCFIWGRDSTKVQMMIQDLQSRDSIQAWGLEIKAAETLDDLVSKCNLIVTTTSPIKCKKERISPRWDRTITGSRSLKPRSWQRRIWSSRTAFHNVLITASVFMRFKGGRLRSVLFLNWAT